MAHRLLRDSQPDMLLLWDRNFLSYRTVAEVRARRAHLLARIKSNLIFTPIRVLSDGSYLAKLYRNAADRRRRPRRHPGADHRVHLRRPRPPRLGRAASAA